MQEETAMPTQLELTHTVRAVAEQLHAVKHTAWTAVACCDGFGLAIGINCG